MASRSMLVSERLFSFSISIPLSLEILCFFSALFVYFLAFLQSFLPTMLLSRLGSLVTTARSSASASMCSAPLPSRFALPTVQSRAEGRMMAAKRSTSSSSTRSRPPRLASALPAVAAAASSSSSTTVTLKVEGMVCSKCTDRVENALMAVEGVKDARADLGTGEVKVEVVNESSSASAAAAATALAAAVEELGFGAVVA